MEGGHTPLSLFSGYGIEIEYMIVDRDGLDVRPLTDQVLRHAAGDLVEEVPRGTMAWSNELVLHVVELKCNGPSTDLAGLAAAFQGEVGAVLAILDTLDATLMPTAMHPWMNPLLETRLWPHGYNEIYATFDRIFDCTGHGWSNLQSMHVNLPFSGDREFEQLHAAIRTLLPILPAIAASSPLAQWELTGHMDTRLEMYRHNARRIPEVTGQVIPEVARSRDEYERVVLAPMYQAIAPHDPGGILQYEWLNARGAIARFDRDAIEIRVLDTQECPAQDLAIAQATVAVLRALSGGTFADLPTQHELATADLARLFNDCVRDADHSIIDDRAYLRALHFPERRAQARELWQHLLESVPATAADQDWREAMGFILRTGCLARRITGASGGGRRSHIEETYRVLCQCLAGGDRFVGID